jgi:hypothetical protein
MTIPPSSRRRLSTTTREALYDRCRGAAEFPTCNICGQLILVGDAGRKPRTRGGALLLWRDGDRRRASELQPAPRRRGCAAPGRQGHSQPSKAHWGIPDTPQAARRPDGLAEAEGRRKRCCETMRPQPGRGSQPNGASTRKLPPFFVFSPFAAAAQSVDSCFRTQEHMGVRGRFL